MTTVDAVTRVRVLRGFDDPALARFRWSARLGRGGSDVVFLTREWQLAWWEAFGRGELLLIAAERGREITALAPLFADSGMVFFVGSGGSDYLDFVGDVGERGVLEEILRTAVELTPGFVGFRFYHVPDDSPTGSLLAEAAERVGLSCVDEGELPAPSLDLTDAEAVEGVLRKKSLVRHERWFDQNGALAVTHLRDGEEIIPHLETFMDQHVERWARTESPSLFLDPRQRAFYRALCSHAADAGWLRFTRVDWNGAPIAFHFGSSYAGEYLCYKPSFDIGLAQRSPGKVLWHQLLLAAIEEGCRVFDLGLGDEPFKQTFATGVRTVRTWGLYPREGTA